MLLVLTFGLVLVTAVEWTYAASPILIVPGLRGSQLEARISDNTKCDTKGEWKLYWISFAKYPKCVNRVLTMQYDSQTNTYTNYPGIEVRAPGFGLTDTVEYLDDAKSVGYFNEFVEYFVQNGYKRNETIRAAPYDWRLAPDLLEKSGYYEDVKKLVELMYEQSTTNEQVTIVAHSMGGPVSLYFLNKYVTQTWKDQYIHAYIPLSGAWTGGNRGLAQFVSEICVACNPYSKLFTSSYKTMSSSVWLLPNPSVWGNEDLIETQTKMYSANDYEEMFTDINRTVDYKRFNLSLSINGDYPPPNVTVHCYYGINIQTPEVFYYGRGFPKNLTAISYGNGDGVVNLTGSEICLRWSSQQEPFDSKKFPLKHMQMVQNETVFVQILEDVQTLTHSIYC